MTLILVILLAAVWGALFLPALLRARQSTSPIVSVGMFRNSMRALSAGRGGRWVVMPRDPQEEAQTRKATIVRRRKAFVLLLGFAGASLLLGLLPPLRFMLVVHLFADVALAGFVGYLIWSRQVDEHEEYAPRHGSSSPEPDDEDFEYLQASQF